MRAATRGYVEKGAVVGRILIHLDRQSSPSDFRVFGPRVVPFYNYLQAAFVLHEDGSIPARAVLKVAQDLAFAHNFDSGALARSYLDLSRRGHVTGAGDPRAVGGLRGDDAGAARGGERDRRGGGGAREMLPDLQPPVVRGVAEDRLPGAGGDRTTSAPSTEAMGGHGGPPYTDLLWGCRIWFELQLFELQPSDMSDWTLRVGRASVPALRGPAL